MPLATFASVIAPSATCAVSIALVPIFDPITALSTIFTLLTEPSASFAVVIDASATFAVVTEPSAIFAEVIASFATVGFGYVPVRSPPADPLGGSDVGAPLSFE